MTPPGRVPRPLRPAALALAAMLSAFATRSARGDMPLAPGDSGGLPASFSAKPTDLERHEKRQDRLGVLAVYTVVAAAVVGASYLLRDDFVGRGVATTAAGWGGLSVGATAGWVLAAAGSCQVKDCTDDNVGAAAGGLIGGVAGSIAGYFLTTHGGMSRVYTTAGGMAPFVLVLGAATIAQW